MKYILIVFTLFSCNNISRHNDSRKVSTELLDTIKSVPAKVITTPVLFATAFIKGTTQSVNNTTLNLYGITIGKIKVVSGHLIACDPLHIDEYGIPFTQVFPTGEFPAQLSIARSNDEGLIAFARIKFNEEPVLNIQTALQHSHWFLPVLALRS